MEKLVFVETYTKEQLDNAIKDLVFNDLKGEYEVIIRKVNIGNVVRYNVIIRNK